MLNIGFSELLLIAVVALVFIGPNQLPGVLRGILKFFRELQNLGDEVKQQFHDAVKESGLEGTTTIIDLDGKKQLAYDVNELETLKPTKAQADE